MLYNKAANPNFEWRLCSVPDGTQPGGLSFGTSIVPNLNTYGSYTEVINGTLVTNDVFGIHIWINSNNVNGEARDSIMTIGIDEAGGTSYTDKISHLLCSCASDVRDGGGVHYYFPLFIKAGSSIAAKASANYTTTQSDMNVAITLFGKPQNPEAVKVGNKVITYGIDTATSSGTPIAAGTVSDGSWTQIATTTSDHWFWQWGYGENDTAMGTNVAFVDIAAGDATNKKIVLSNHVVFTSSSERASKPLMVHDAYVETKSGDIMYGKMHITGSGDDNKSIAVYGVI